MNPMMRTRAAGAAYQAKLPTPFALLGIRTEGGVLAEITFLPESAGALSPRDRLAARACAPIDRYLEDSEFRFDLPIAVQGTAVQRRGSERISAIDAGLTRSYRAIA